MCLLKLLLTFSIILDLAEFSQFGGSQFFGQEDAFDETSHSVNASEGHASDKTNEVNLAVTDRVHNSVQPVDTSREEVETIARDHFGIPSLRDE
jgi:hypothetical protein